MTDNNDDDNDKDHPNQEQEKMPEKENKEKKIDETVKDNIPEEKPKETKEKSLSNISKEIDENQEIKSIEKKMDIFEKRFNKIDETLQSIVKILRDKINYDLLMTPKMNSYRDKNANKLLQNKTRRNGATKIKEEDIYDELYRENLNEEKSTRESKKSYEEDKKFTNKKQEDLHKDLNDNNNTYDINIDNNTVENNFIGSANEAPIRKNNEAYSNTVNDEEKRKNNLSYDSKNQKENNDEITSPQESEEEQLQNDKYQQYPSQNSEIFNNQEQDRDESSLKYKKNNNNNKKRSLLSKKFTKHKNSRKKRQESSYSPSIYNKSKRRVSQSMVNYNQVQDVEDEYENERESEEELSDEQLEKERIEREKKRNEKRERSGKSERERESTFKYYFDGHIINNKKVRWEVKIKQLTGWFSIGVAERQKTSNTNEKQNPITVNVNKQYIIKKINFLMTNDHCTIVWIGDKNQINQFKGVFGIKQGDILTFTFCPKFNQLKVQKNNNTYLIDKINYYGDQWLVPCAIYSRKNDKALFRNFHVLADYNI